MGRAIGEQRYARTKLRNGERIGCHHWVRSLRSQVADDGFSVVRTARTADLVKFGVQQQFEALATAANARMKKLVFQRLKFR